MLPQSNLILFKHMSGLRVWAEVLKSKGWKWKEINKMWEAVKKRDIEGYIAIYENTGCKVGNKLVHQPYFRWIAIPPETQSISANADYELSKNVNVSVGKEDSATREAVAGAKFKVSTTGVSEVENVIM